MLLAAVEKEGIGEAWVEGCAAGARKLETNE